MSRLPAWILSVAGVTYGTGRPLLQSGQPLLHARVWTPRAHRRGGREVFDLSDRVTGFAFESEEGKRDKVTLTVENLDLAYFESPVLTKGTDFSFSFGYRGQLAPGGSAKVQGVRGFEQLTVEAYSLSPGLTTVQKTRQWFMMTRSAMVEQIAREHGVTRTRVAPSVTLDTVQQVGVTDWRFLLELAEPLGYSVYFTVEQGVRVLNFQLRPHDAAPARVFMWGQPGNDSGSAPLLGFSIDDSGPKGKPSKVEVAAHDPDARKTLRETGERATAPAVGKLGFGTEVATPEESSGRNEEAVSVVATAHESADMARGEAATRYQRAQEDQVLATATVEGDQTITTGQIVKIGGVPPFVAGPYYVVGHKHTIAGDGYKTTMKLSRNAVGQSPESPAPPPPPGPPNRKKVSDPHALSTKTYIDKDGKKTAIYQASGR